MKHLQKLGYIAIGSVLTLAVMGTALAATGALTIEVNPINVQVNGQTFQPKDAAGKTVPVFAYNGTTYAPLRALAEAYGLKVGYDAATNMATVGETTPTKTPDKPVADYSTWTAEEEKAYQEFKGMWKVEFDEMYDGYGPGVPAGSRRAVYYLKTINPDGVSKRDSIYTNDTFARLCARFGHELIADKDYDMVTMSFTNGWGVITIQGNQVNGI